MERQSLKTGIKIINLVSTGLATPVSPCDPKMITQDFVEVDRQRKTLDSVRRGLRETLRKLLVLIP